MFNLINLSNILPVNNSKSLGKNEIIDFFNYYLFKFEFMYRKKNIDKLNQSI